MRFVTACTLVLSLAACGSSNAETAADYCNKASDCSAIRNESVDRCTGIVESCLENARPADASDMRDSIGKCVEMNSCRSFLTCAQAIKGC
jgi:hypothetical protein